MADMRQVQRPCRGCVYFKVCGDNMRTVHCNGRMTKRQKRNGRANDA